MHANPARHTEVMLTQPDGTTLKAFLCGDEHCHFYVNADGKMLMQDADGFYRVAGEEEAEAFLKRGSKKAAESNARRMQRSARMRMDGVSTNGQRRAAAHHVGKKKGLVILVNFLDVKMTYEVGDFEPMFNQVGYNKNNHAGSVHDYFYDQSYGQLDVEFDVIGPITTIRNMDYYGKNDAAGNDTHPGTLVIEACRQAKKLGINFADYDWDGNKEVEQVFLIYAGYGENAGASSQTVWPHEWDLNSAKKFNDGDGQQTIDGVKINTYAVSCELSGTTGKNMNGIGTACHEFSHCLGLPDTYDASYQGGVGMGDWDLMASGNYNGPSVHGETPCGFTAFERYLAGWMELTELTEPCSVNAMPPLQDEPVAYIIRNDNNSNEGLILENRQYDKWFTYYGGKNYKVHGLLISHVDYLESAWTDNNVNKSATHQRMSYIPADNNFGTYYNSRYNQTATQFAGDLFPGYMKVSELTNTSHSDSGGTWFNDNSSGTKDLNINITNITEAGRRISFSYKGGEDTPVHSVTFVPQTNEYTYYNLNGTYLGKQRPTAAGIYIEKMPTGETRKIKN